MLLIATKICWKGCRNGYVKLHVQQLLLQPLVNRRNVASVILFYRYYSQRCSFELVELVPRPPSHGKSTRYSGGFHDLSVAITNCYKVIKLCQQLF